ncbi:beta-ketoacyl-[acyl-carrier-protein] synthase family protein [Streptomyces acidiscabies]|uniref:Beta-ketoacyl-[acyl-carrier-protein] synthase family protein n=1 Tax=Streptomyces acidiscabies TaxID=42234 RepID=A0AAP6BLL0_9ACTN|nr:beta-ketoacyl-[acyl-carrier-protein] synthase family protein [Streptomyces acidiscabies]MBP5938322.1 beta-ketoacyl-[acyl-carrier-protein] synthase family protein [Streptomyces sp. LBUM 1476]MBZ3909354.1 beta-ketoacyl-[acyl-carrier-protein] synthase family protein [Streptomyces acidiscabies]MDX2966865.1 beta-ketoacyl-[acyl-carrier-protein] synthase family protein [Streptomyces acidiscabies]MDX3019954.1 beta-ketoacyl-[acyl-carrier-protein] synthase family protein [Streptomyces acidiscabies]MD
MNGVEVAVTGIGLVTPGGTGREATWRTVLEGRATAARVPQLKGLNAEFACTISDPPSLKQSWQYDRHTRFALAAADEALADAGLDPGGWDGERVAVVVGTAFGGTESQLGQHERLLSGAKVSPYLVPMFLPNMAAAQVALRIGARGPVSGVSTACASGATAIGTAMGLLRDGVCDVALAGGADAAVHPLWIAGFDSMGALSRRGESRPFDASRDGFVMGEGAGILVLERVVDAQRRGRRGYAVLAGYGASGDAHHAVAPDPTGRGAERAVRGALASAGVDASDVDHINSHGTSTPLNDKAEAAVIARCFPHGPSVTSAKGALGHLLGAAGAVEAALTALTLSYGQVPPIAGLLTPDAADLDLVTTARTASPAIAVSHSFGFGGHNTALVLRSWEH